MGTGKTKRRILLPLLLCLAGLASACFEKADLPLLDGSTDPVGDDVQIDGIDTEPDRIDVPDISEDPTVEDMPADPAEDLFCEPDSMWCDGADLVTCNAEGSAAAADPCPLGCSSTGEAHCMEVVPSNFPDASYLCMDGTEALDVPVAAGFVRFDTETGAIDIVDAAGDSMENLRGAAEGMNNGIHFAVIGQAGGPDLGVFSVQSMQITAGTYAYGRGPNALVILACGDVAVAGRLGADAQLLSAGPGAVLFAGPGGASPGEGAGAGEDGTSNAPVTYDSGGGGGAGFGGAGGAGGNDWGGSGGSSYGNEELTPLLGGSGGGTGADNDAPMGMGGPGGGALQITATGTISVPSGGIVTAGGFGGIGGLSSGAGGGAGSGGGILLEAIQIVIESGAVVAANGGGGGGAGSYSSPGTPGEMGQAGQPSDVAAVGGAPVNPANGCRGGNGNSGTGMNGGTLPCTVSNGGGGGGGAGRIRLNALAAPVMDGVLSPDPNATDTKTTTGPLNLQ